MISRRVISSMATILLMVGSGLATRHRAGSWPALNSPSSPTMAAMRSSPSSTMTAMKNPSSSSSSWPWTSCQCQGSANQPIDISKMTPRVSVARNQGLEKGGVRKVARLLKKMKRNNSTKRMAAGDIGYGMKMVADLLDLGNVKDRNTDVMEEQRNQQTNLNIPEQAIIRSL